MMPKLTLILLLCFTAPPAIGESISFFDFFISSGVTISADGQSAHLDESASSFLTFLENVPSDGDPFVIVPNDGVSFVMDYSFVEGMGDDDEFGVVLLDSNNDAVDTFLLGSSGSGQVMFDLTGLTGEVLGLSIQLNSFDFVLGSSAVVSNPRLAVIPLPGALVFFSAALLSLAPILRRPTPS